jgi:aminomethyltransferase
MLKSTQLFEAYKDRARLTEFSGYTMPLFFTGIIEEVLAVRNSVGIFDVSHMGRFRIKGDGSEALLELLLTTDVAKAESGRAMYSFMCNERGGIIDDLIVYKVDRDDYYMVVNCSNREKDLQWLNKWSSGKDVLVSDITDASILVAVQGPNANRLLQDFEISDIKRFRFKLTHYEGHIALIARTGYTGEDGFEILVEGVTKEQPSVELGLWNALKSKLLSVNGLEAGLGARDTLRLEAGLPLHGNDITEEVTPFEAGLERFVDLTKPDYIGKSVHKIQVTGTSRKLIGMVCQERMIPRSHNPVFKGGKQVGFVTSGTYSPTIGRAICMAMVESDSITDGSFEIEIRGTKCRAEPSQMPFYDPETYGYRRKRKVES